jgi:hypothetical protein
VNLRLAVVANYVTKAVDIAEALHDERRNQFAGGLHTEASRNARQKIADEQIDRSGDAHLDWVRADVRNEVGQFDLLRPRGFCHPTGYLQWYQVVPGGTASELNLWNSRADRERIPNPTYGCREGAAPPAGIEPSDLPGTNRALCAATKRTPLSYGGA